MNDEENVSIQLVRLESKLDLLAIQLLALSNRDDDFEKRIRDIERKKVVTVPAMWAALTSVAALVSVAMPILITSYSNVGR
jgi:hypothetical protein